MIVAAIAVEKSQNAKLGACSATYVSQDSCSDTCPFKNNGCYAEDGYVGMISKRLNGASREAKLTPLELAHQEAAAIRGLKGSRPLRLHVVGDCDDPWSTEIVSKAASEHPGPVWTYTHSWRHVGRDSWNRVSVLASVETTEDAHKAKERGYASAIVVDQFEQEKAYEKDGLTIIPCPAQTRGITCAECLLCTRDGWLHRTKRVIAFAAHGPEKTRRKVIQTIGGKK